MGETSFHIDERNINYFEGPPSGNPLVLLHGVTGRWQTFSHLVPFFTPNYHVYACDLRGHGKSGHVPGGYTSEGYASDINQFIQQIVKQPAAVFGHSLGGRIAIHLAASYPKRISAIIVGDTPLTPLSSQGDSVKPFIRVFGLWKALKDKKLSTHELAIQLGQLPARAKADGTPQVYADFWNQADLLYTARCIQLVDDEILMEMASGSSSKYDNLLETLSSVRCPVFFLQGDENFGALLTKSDLDIAIKQTKTPYYAQIEGAGHGIHEDKPLEVAKMVLRFLSAHDI